MTLTTDEPGAGLIASEPMGAPGDGILGPAGNRRLTVIRARSGWQGLNLGELWRYRELLYFLAWRDVKVRYKQTALGAAWAILQPLLSMAIFTLFLGRWAGVPSDGLPYPLFAYTGLLVWTYFANAATNASGSLVANTNLISKIYFPRLIVPLSGVLSGLVDLAIGAVLLIAILLVSGFAPSGNLLFAPLFIFLAIWAAAGVGVWLSALDVQYRDVRYAFPFLVQVWLFASPVVYPASLVPDQYRALYGLNPMAGIIEGFRWSVLGHAFPGAMVAVSTIVVVVLAATGALYFRRVERGFADVI